MTTSHFIQMDHQPAAPARSTRVRIPINYNEDTPVRVPGRVMRGAAFQAVIPAWPHGDSTTPPFGVLGSKERSDRLVSTAER